MTLNAQRSLARSHRQWRFLASPGCPGCALSVSRSSKPTAKHVGAIARCSASDSACLAADPGALLDTADARKRRKLTRGAIGSKPKNTLFSGLLSEPR